MKSADPWTRRAFSLVGHKRKACIAGHRSQSVHPWPKELRRWVASKRQVIETVFDKLQHTFGLRRERPHSLGGFAARLAARVDLHNFCIYLNRLLDRPNLAFADLVDW